MAMTRVTLPSVSTPILCTSLVCLWGLAACGSDAEPVVAGNVDVATVIMLDASGGVRGRAPGEPDPDAGPVVSCEPGSSVCLSEVEWARCDYNGRGFGIIHSCTDGYACDAALSVCKPIYCVPGALHCESADGRRRCSASGTGFEADSFPCPGDGVCVQGEVEGVCKPCRPGEMYCVSVTQAARCDELGEQPMADSEVACAPGEVCRIGQGSCATPVCEPGAQRCATSFSVETCDIHGSAWLDAKVACDEAYVCQEGQCVYRPCLDNVLFVVDRSGSMEGTKWAQARQAVVQVVSDNPSSLFGLKAFPTSGCAVSQSADIPIASTQGEVAEVFGAWFDANDPSGSTPLVAVMERIASAPERFFGVYGGAIIVLSDGGESCYDSDVQERLAQATSALFSAHDISTYVIGFDSKVAPQQLNTIAYFGGTSMSSYIPVSQTDSLADAFQGILDDFKLCGGLD